MINIDADGVMVDWQGYVIENHFPHLTIDQLNAIPPTKRSMVLSAMYRQDPDLFYKLKPIAGASELLEHIDRTGEPWRVLTSAGTDHPDYARARDCKIANLGILYGIPEDRILVTETSEAKANYVHTPGDVLIDDFHRNIKQWRAAGGIGILVPNPPRWPDVYTALSEAINPICV